MVPADKIQSLRNLLQKIPRSKKNALLWTLPLNLDKTVKFLLEFRTVAQQHKTTFHDLAAELGIDPAGAQYLLAGKNTMGKPLPDLLDRLEGRSLPEPRSFETDSKRGADMKLLKSLQAQLAKAGTLPNPHIREATKAYFEERIRILKEDGIRKILWKAPSAKNKYAKLAEKLARECLAFGDYKKFMAEAPCFNNMSAGTDLRSIWPELRWENTTMQESPSQAPSVVDSPSTEPIKVRIGGGVVEIPPGTPNIPELVTKILDRQSSK
jgi:hypothetical protein